MGQLRIHAAGVAAWACVWTDAGREEATRKTKEAELQRMKFANPTDTKDKVRSGGLV
jgi:hypothetical protein